MLLQCLDARHRGHAGDEHRGGRSQEPDGQQEPRSSSEHVPERDERCAVEHVQLAEPRIEPRRGIALTGDATVIERFPDGRATCLGEWQPAEQERHPQARCHDDEVHPRRGGKALGLDTKQGEHRRGKGAANITFSATVSVGSNWKN